MARICQKGKYLVTTAELAWGYESLEGWPLSTSTAPIPEYRAADATPAPWRHSVPPPPGCPRQAWAWCVDHRARPGDRPVARGPCPQRGYCRRDEPRFPGPDAASPQCGGRRRPRSAGRDRRRPPAHGQVPVAERAIPRCSVTSPRRWLVNCRPGPSSWPISSSWPVSSWAAPRSPQPWPCTRPSRIADLRTHHPHARPGAQCPAVGKPQASVSSGSDLVHQHAERQ